MTAPTSFKQIEIQNEIYDAFGFWVLADNGDIVYMGRRGTVHTVETAGKMRKWVSSNGGTSWSQSDIVDSSTYDERNAAGGIASTGTIMLFFGRYYVAGSSWYDIRYYRSTNDGSSFTDVGEIDTGSDTAFSPYGAMIELPSGKLMQTFYGINGTTYRIYVQFSTDDGLTWGNEVTVVSSSSIQWTEGCAVYIDGATDAAARLVIVARTNNGVMRQLTSTNGGASWTDDGTLSFSQGSGLDVSPWLKVLGSTLYLVWADRTDFRFYCNTATASSVPSTPSAWGTKSSIWQSISYAYNNLGYPSLGIYGGALHAMFFDAIGYVDSDLYHSFPTGSLTTGPRLPTAAVTASETPWRDNDWTTPTNIYDDDAATANITASTFDTGDQSYVLKGYTFNFSVIPDGSTIKGVICYVNTWYRTGTGSGSMDLMQLLDTSGAKVGTNQCSTAVALTTTNTTIIQKGSGTDLWGNSLTAAWVKDVDFGVALGILSTGTDTDVDIDFVALEIFYDPPVLVIPSPVSAIGNKVDPTVVISGGGTTVTPTPITAIGSKVDPTVALGSTSVTPSPVAAIGDLVNPTVVLGSLVLLPVANTAIGSVVDPTVQMGSVLVTPAAVYALGQIVDPAVVLGSTSLVPDSVIAVGTVVDPVVLGGGVIVTPSAVAGIGATIAPTVILGSLNLVPTAAGAIGSVVDPIVLLSGLAVTPAAVYAIGRTVNPTVVHGSIVLTPAATGAIGAVVAPTVRLGSTLVIPVAVSAIGRVVAPTVIISWPPAPVLGRTAYVRPYYLLVVVQESRLAKALFEARSCSVVEARRAEVPVEARTLVIWKG